LTVHLPGPDRASNGSASRSRLDLRALVQAARERHAATAADRALAYRIFVLFERICPFETRELQFYVSGGAISVFGIVESEHARESILSELANLPGALRITENLHCRTA
jgi:hypothetical protein